MSSINSAVKKNPEASNSVRMVRICMAMPPENARKNPPSTAMRQSRTSARSRYEKATKNDMANTSESTRAARVAAVQLCVKSARWLTGGSADSDETLMRPSQCSARSHSLSSRIDR